MLPVQIRKFSGGNQYRLLTACNLKRLIKVHDMYVRSMLHLPKPVLLLHISFQIKFFTFGIRIVVPVITKQIDSLHISVHPDQIGTDILEIPVIFQAAALGYLSLSLLLTDRQNNALTVHLAHDQCHRYIVNLFQISVHLIHKLFQLLIAGLRKHFAVKAGIRIYRHCDDHEKRDQRDR